MKTHAAQHLLIVTIFSERVTTFAFSMTLANSPLHMKQCFGVMRRKQSPLFREWAVGSTKRTWMCLRPTDKAATNVTDIKLQLNALFVAH